MQLSNTAQRGVKSALCGMFAVVCLTLGSSPAHTEGTELSFNDFVKKVTIKGDFRIRQESFFNVDAQDRHRQRYRLRVGADFDLPAGLQVKTKFASGGGEQVSTNQTFSDLSQQKGIFIDQAYVNWKQSNSFAARAGRMANPLWTTYSSDVVWDGDFNPEGFAEQIKFGVPFLGNVRGFFNALQMVADEVSGTNKDPWLFSNQIGLEFLVFDQSKLKMAGTLHEWAFENDPNVGTLGGSATASQGGNSKSSGRLLNHFRVWELTGDYGTNIIGTEIPVSLQTTFVKNTKDQLSTNYTQGFQSGVIIGKAKPGKFEGAWFYKQVQAEATLADVADSDFGSAGGTGRKGHIWWLGYGVNKALTVQTKFFTTNAYTITGGRINRMQADMQFKF